MAGRQLRLGVVFAGLVLAGSGTLAADAEVAGTVVLSVGEAQLGTQAARAGIAVRVGDRLATGATGYLHIKTIDNGFLILRPQSVARVAAYHVDTQDPARNRIKIELDRGVARSISGEAVKNARQHFRFNTPLAAIGVRGTDFTVFTDPQASRVQVASGGVVVSGFGGGCTPDGSGPCEGPNARELFAGQADRLLQINRGQMVPQVLRNGGSAPDVSAPPHSEEPPVKTGAIPGSSTDINLAPMKLAGLERVEAPAPGGPTLPSGPSALQWGRWQALADRGAEMDLNKVAAEYAVAGINEYYALLHRKDAAWQAPATGVASFALQGGQAVVAEGNHTQLASIENGKLSVDFNRGSFATQFDLLTQGERLQRQASGSVGGDGTFSNPSQFLANNNMVVQGVLANAPNGGLNAAYLFQSRLDEHRVAYGATYWGK